MPRMMRSWVICPWSMRRVSMDLPSRMMVTASATLRISLSLWLMMMLVTPWPFRCRIRSSRWSESSSFRAAVGSSRISSFTSLDSALAISTSCCLPTLMCWMGVIGFSSRPTRASSLAASRLVLRQSTQPREAISLPRKMFSAMDRYGLSASSWWMITMPRFSLSLMDAKSHGSFSKRMSPSKVCGRTRRRAPSSGWICLPRFRRRSRGPRRGSHPG